MAVTIGSSMVGMSGKDTYHKCVELGRQFLVGASNVGGCVYCGLPQDYMPCDDCGYDHNYEPVEAKKFHSQEVVGR